MRKFGILLLFAALLLPFGARAAVIDTVSFSGAAGVEGDDIRLWYGAKQKAHCLFLPSCAPDTLTIAFTGAESIEIEGKTYRNGDRVAGLTGGAKVTLQIGKKSYPLYVFQSAGVPAVFISPDSGSLDYIHKAKKYEEPAGMLLVDAEGETLYDGRLERFKGRGHYSFNLKKKPYNIKLETSTNLFGMGKDKSWVLLANYTDNSLLRNAMTFDLARAVGLAYTPEYQFVDLYACGDYLGTYMLTEKIKIDDDRVDIASLEDLTEALNGDLSVFPRVGSRGSGKDTMRGYQIPVDPEDITGGYLMEIDQKNRYEAEASGFVTRLGQAVVVHSPEYASEAQITYISSLFGALERALRADDGVDAQTGKHYSEIIDVESLAKRYVIEEFCRNYDANQSSQYFYKPADSQSTFIYAGPVWDYDIAYANTDRDDGAHLDPRGLQVGTQGYQFSVYTNAYGHEEFRALARKYYREVFRSAIDILLGDAEGNDTISSIDDMASGIRASADMNYIRWPVFNISGRAVKTGADYDENLTYIKDFIRARAEYLDGLWAE